MIRDRWSALRRIHRRKVEVEPTSIDSTSRRAVRLEQEPRMKRSFDCVEAIDAPAREAVRGQAVEVRPRRRDGYAKGAG